MVRYGIPKWISNRLVDAKRMTVIFKIRDQANGTIHSLPSGFMLLTFVSWLWLHRTGPVSLAICAALAWL